MVDQNHVVPFNDCNWTIKDHVVRVKRIIIGRWEVTCSAVWGRFSHVSLFKPVIMDTVPGIKKKYIYYGKKIELVYPQLILGCVVLFFSSHDTSFVCWRFWSFYMLMRIKKSEIALLQGFWSSFLFPFFSNLFFLPPSFLECPIYGAKFLLIVFIIFYWIFSIFVISIFLFLLHPENCSYYCLNFIFMLPRLWFSEFLYPLRRAEIDCFFIIKYY